MQVPCKCMYSVLSMDVPGQFEGMPGCPCHGREGQGCHRYIQDVCPHNANMYMKNSVSGCTREYPDHGSVYTECTVHGCNCNMYMDNSQHGLSVHAMTERGVGSIWYI